MGMEHLREQWRETIVSSTRHRRVSSIDEARARRALMEHFASAEYDEIVKGAMPSWRGLAEGPVWTKYDACVITDPTGSKRRTFETFIDGQTDRRLPTLAEAKAYVESKIGPCTWQRIKAERQVVEHYYFGETDMFTDPSTIYAATRT
jgi:hypothetical protein